MLGVKGRKKLSGTNDALILCSWVKKADKGKETEGR
jgi:hypothetical protein